MPAETAISPLPAAAAGDSPQAGSRQAQGVTGKEDSGADRTGRAALCTQLAMAVAADCPDSGGTAGAGDPGLAPPSTAWWWPAAQVSAVLSASLLHGGGLQASAAVHLLCTPPCAALWRPAVQGGGVLWCLCSAQVHREAGDLSL